MSAADLLQSVAVLVGRGADLVVSAADLLQSTADLLQSVAVLVGRGADLVVSAADLLQSVADLLQSAAVLVGFDADLGVSAPVLRQSGAYLFLFADVVFQAASDLGGQEEVLGGQERVGCVSAEVGSKDNEVGCGSAACRFRLAAAVFPEIPGDFPRFAPRGTGDGGRRRAGAGPSWRALLAAGDLRYAAARHRLAERGLRLGVSWSPPHGASVLRGELAWPPS